MPNKTIVAIAALTAILITCVIKDIDGALVGSVSALIADLGGFAYGKYKR